MKKISIPFLVLLSLAAGIFLVNGAYAFAQNTTTTVGMKNSFPEQIDYFRSDITLNKDATISVVETINYDFKELERHGIYRDIRLSKVAGSLYRLRLADGIAVEDEAGRGYVYEVKDGNPVHIQIGQPDVLISGKHVYKISYSAENAIGYFNDRDEIYWNATGNEWQVPIMAAETHVYVPGDRRAKNFVASYCGPLGSKEPCDSTLPSYNPATDMTEFVFTYPTTTRLYSGFGMTIAVGFEKGVLASPTKLDRVLAWLSDHWFYPVPLIIVVLWFKKPFKRWLRRRKFYKNNPLVVEYDANGFSPLESAGTLHGGILPKDLSAEIIYLATQGYLNIRKNDDIYSFVSTGKNTDGLKYYDRALLDGIAGKNESELSDAFYVTAEIIRTNVGEELERNNIIEPRKIKKGFKPDNKWVVLGVAFFLAVNPGIFVWLIAGWKFGFIFSVSAVLIGILSLFFGFCSGVLTDAGFEAERKLLGLKHYIKMAEEERINFHNAPEKNPATFEKLLPYAMIFGLEKKWAKEFEGIYTVPPQWYSDTSMSSFSAITFGSSLGNFTNSSSSALFSSPSSSSSGSSDGGSSGSSGGGSSGGGGGGGGGGSW